MQPTAYVPQTDFQDEEDDSVAGRSTVRTAMIDAEFDAIAVTLSETLENLALIQRDDGALMDEIVTTESLSPTVRTLISTTGINPRGAWLTATSYAVKDVIETSTPLISYICVVAHVSGVFATDRAAGKWMVLGEEPGTGSFTSITITTGGISLVTNNTQDLAATANRFRTGYFGTSLVFPLWDSGAATLAQIKINGTTMLNIQAGQVIPTVNLGLSLGDSTHKFSQIFADTLIAQVVDSGTAGPLALRTNNGQKQVQIFDAGGTAANFMSLGGALAGNPITILASGTDGNIGIQYEAKGTGFHNFYADAGATLQFQILRTAGANRNITITGSNGGNPTIGVTGGSLAITPNVTMAGTLVVAGSNIQVGTNPSGTGALNLAYAAGLWTRNGANNNDMGLIASGTLNAVQDIVQVGIAGLGVGVVWKARSGGAAPTSGDLPAGCSVVWRDTGGATTKVYYNNAGAIIASAAFT